MLLDCTMSLWQTPYTLTTHTHTHTHTLTASTAHTRRKRVQHSTSLVWRCSRYARIFQDKLDPTRIILAQQWRKISNFHWPQKIWCFPHDYSGQCSTTESSSTRSITEFPYHNVSSRFHGSTASPRSFSIVCKFYDVYELPPPRGSEWGGVTNVVSISAIIQCRQHERARCGKWSYRTEKTLH